MNPDLCVPPLPKCRKGAGSPEVTPIQPTTVPGGDPDLDLRPQQVGGRLMGGMWDMGGGGMTEGTWGESGDVGRCRDVGGI